MNDKLDLVVIGAGSGGVAAARRAASYGAKVAICEGRDVGGTCVLRGCIPKKLLVYGSAVRKDLDTARAYGWNIREAEVDWSRLVAAKNTEVKRLEKVYEKLLADSKVAIVRGYAKLVDGHTVEVAGQRLRGERVLIATGGHPVMPEIPGIELAMHSDGALDLAALPQHITIVGGGYIAMEFAGIFAGAGAQVRVLIRGDGPLRGFDQDVRSSISEALGQAGIEVCTDATVAELTKVGGRIGVVLKDGRGLETDAVLMATGRAPNTASLGLAQVGVATDDQGAIEVDDWSRTSVAGIFAVGDCTGRPALTPMAIADGRAFADTEFGGRPHTRDHDHVPHAVFSQPPLAAVGLTEAEARERGPVRVYRSRFRPLKQTLTQDAVKTMMKLVVDDASDRVVGVHVVGPDAAEIIQGFAVALVCGATKAQFDQTLAIHPTAAEELVTMGAPVG